jgi:hypothetical protein
MQQNYSFISSRAAPNKNQLAKMASNYKKEPLFLLKRTWEDSTKLPNKYKFQETVTWNKSEYHIDSGILGMDFFIEWRLPSSIKLVLG